MCYGLSFWILAGFWRNNHQQFYFIKRSNPTLITINVFWLLLIALMPFSTEIISEYGGTYFTANIIFQLNLFFAGLLYGINWLYAVKAGLVDEDLNKQTLSLINKYNVITPILSICALGFSFYFFAWSNVIYLLGPLLKSLIDKKYSKESWILIKNKRD